MGPLPSRSLYTLATKLTLLFLPRAAQLLIWSALSVCVPVAVHQGQRPEDRNKPLTQRCAQSPSNGPGAGGSSGAHSAQEVPCISRERAPCCLCPQHSGRCCPKRLCLPKGAALANLCSRTVPLFHLTQRVTLTRHLLPFAKNTQALRP